MPLMQEASFCARPPAEGGRPVLRFADDGRAWAEQRRAKAASSSWHPATCATTSLARCWAYIRGCTPP
eukprot:1190242-Prorocentrum_minimum.AAC.1